MNKKSGSLASFGAIFVLAPLTVAMPLNAATITSWNTSNVAVAETPADYDTGYSLVYDGSPADSASTSTGQIAFTPPEAVSPGIKIVNGEFTLGGPGRLTVAGCVMASSSATCDSEFQSGKRFKEHLTSTSPIDLVFDVDPTGEAPAGSIGYQVFQRVVNKSGGPLAGVTVELGYGLGDSFTASTAGDGLGFSTEFLAPPDRDVSASSQFPFGLFGDADGNPNFELDGFFAAERTGYEMSITEDTIATGDFFGTYEDQFGSWMGEETIPEGGFWDFDDDETTDDLLMARQLSNDLWEVRRALDDDGTPMSITPRIFASLEDAESFLSLSLVTDLIDDLANLNLNYVIALGDVVDFSQFTMRVTATPCTIVPTTVSFSLLGSPAYAGPEDGFCVNPPLAPVPLPASAPMILFAMGAIALVRRFYRVV